MVLSHETGGANSESGEFFFFFFVALGMDGRDGGTTDCCSLGRQTLQCLEVTEVETGVVCYRAACGVIVAS